MPDRLRTEKAEFPQEKAKIASEVLLDLPDWFGAKTPAHARPA